MVRPSITLIEAAGRHQRGLAEALARAGILSRAVRSTPDLEILEPGPGGELKVLRRFPSHRHVNRAFWALRRRLPPAWRAFVPMTAWSRIVDYRVSQCIIPSDVFHGLLGASLLSLQRAKQLGAITLVDNSTLHPLAFRREVIADYAATGVRPDAVDPVMPLSMVRRCERQFEMCDRILVYSAAAQRSFEPYPYARKTVVIHPGVDHRVFTPAPARRRDGPFRVCFVGRIEAPKGIHHLAEVWKRLRLPDAELALAGKMLPEMTGLDTDAGSARIRLAGILRHPGVAEFLRDADLFVFPSVNEGLSLALLEAMSCGLPAIACRGTGADDCITPGREGLLVPGRNTEALADAILWCYEHRDELPAMGAAARNRIESGFTLDLYLERLISLYRSLTGCVSVV